VLSALDLPDGRRIGLNADVAPRLCAGVLVAQDATVRQEQAVWERTALLGQRLREIHGRRKPAQIAGLQEARALYNAFGMEPTRHRPSSEALLRRVLQGKDLYHINNVVDCGNLASLSFLLPIGLYDFDRIAGDVELRIGADGAQYPGIRKAPVHVGGRLTLVDDRGPFGSPTSDSARTAVDEATRRLLAVVMATNAYPSSRMEAHLALLGDLFAEHCGARIATRGILRSGDAA
jgi:DNA/RNA-binding domain of Phe-tRNA-synthetase-like protein